MGSRGRRWAIYVAVVALLGALSALAPGGVRKYLALDREVQRMRAENAQLAADNGQLSLEVRALRTDPAALERAIREELRYVRPGERVYVLQGDAGGSP